MADEDYAKPVPEPSRDSRPYWDALREGRLVIQACGACGKLRHYPRPVCDACYSMEVAWRQVSGRGRIYSWTVSHHPFHPGFKSELPYVLATVDLEEGVRMLAQLRGVAPEEVAVGLPVEVAFERATEELTLPVFVHAGAPGQPGL
jgi:uncharacterized OB-fold protein